MDWVKIIFFSLFLIRQCSIVSYADTLSSSYPQIGRTCPDFTLREVSNYSSKTISLNSIKGKWIILDFWSVGCVSCVENFPKIDQLQKKFKGKVEFILVGLEDKRIRSVYKTFQERYHLDLTFTFDKEIFEKFQIKGVPHVIWIDNEQVVRAVTAKSKDINETNLSAFLSGEPFTFDDYSVQAQLFRDNFYTSEKPLLIEGNGGKEKDFLFRSLLMKTQPNTRANIPPFIGVGATGNDGEGRWGLIHDNRVEGTRMSLSALYELAYGDTIRHVPIMSYGGNPPTTSYGKYWQKPILEIKDSSDFITNDETLQGYYNYSLVVPMEKAVTSRVQKIMQRDLRNYFDFEVQVELRMMPCWKIMTAEASRENLSTRGGAPRYELTATSLETKNRPVFDIVHMLWDFNQNAPPFIDETGIIGNIDISIKAELKNFEETKKALYQNGLLLEKGVTEMKVIVIRDAKN